MGFHRSRQPGAREAAYASWMESEDAPANAQAYLDALKSYAITGRPYQTLAAAEYIDISNRETDLLKNGDQDVETTIVNIIEEASPVLQEAFERLSSS